MATNFLLGSSWIDSAQAKLNSPSYGLDGLFPDLHFSLEDLKSINTMPIAQVEGCAAAAALASGGGNGQLKLHEAILASPFSQTSTTDIRAGIKAGALGTMASVYYNFIDTIPALEGYPDKLRTVAYGTNGGTSKDRFESYLLAAALVNNCNFCITTYTNLLKTNGYPMDRIKDIGRISAIIKAVVYASNLYQEPPATNIDQGGL